MSEPPHGTFVDTQTVALRTDANSEIHYTLDGTTPSLQSPVYQEPVRVENTVRLRARAYLVKEINDAADAAESTGTEAGVVGGVGVFPQRIVMRQGLELAGSYIRVAPDTATFTSDLPIIVVHTLKSGPLDVWGTDYVPALLQVHEPNQGRAALVGPATLDTRIGIHVRGESSRRESTKQQYSIEFWAEDADADVDRPMLGMPADSDWNLCDPLLWDRSSIRNAFGLELSNRIGRYAPRTRFAEAFLTTETTEVIEADFLGLFTVVERVKRGRDRVSVEKLASTAAPDDLTGGYIIRIDKGDIDFNAGDENWQFIYPKPEEMALPERTPHLDYIRTYIDDFTAALTSADFRHPDDHQRYSEYIDVDSFIDYNILNAFVKNPDVFRFSTYFHKDRGGLLQAGPVWDLDRTVGTKEEWRSSTPDEWFQVGSDGSDYLHDGFWGTLLTDPEFKSRYIERFKLLIQNEFSATNTNLLIDELARKVAEAAQRNYERWPEYPPMEGGLAAEIEWMKEFLSHRRAFIQSELDAGLPLDTIE